MLKHPAVFFKQDNELLSIISSFSSVAKGIFSWILFANFGEYTLNLLISSQPLKILDSTIKWYVVISNVISSFFVPQKECMDIPLSGSGSSWHRISQPDILLLCASYIYWVVQKISHASVSLSCHLIIQKTSITYFFGHCVCICYVYIVKLKIKRNSIVALNCVVH